MYKIPRFLSVFHMKFVRIVQSLWILCVSQPKLTLRELVENVEVNYFLVLFVFSCMLGQPNNNSMEHSSMQV